MTAKERKVKLYAHPEKDVHWGKEILMLLVSSWYIQTLLKIWIYLEELVSYNGNWNAIAKQVLTVHPRLLLVTIAGLALIRILTRGKEAQILDFMFRRRYILAAAVLCVFVALDINGSSINILKDYVPLNDSGVLLGTARGIRSDEWVVHTPMAFSQEANNYGYTSPILRGARTDMFMVYGQAVAEPVILFRPFYIGYLLFGSSRGLSFFWSSRLLALLLISFEFGRLFTNDNRRNALYFALLLSFSPLVQWWFAVNNLVELLVSGFGAILLFDRYLGSESCRSRLLCALGIVECGCVFIMGLYPAWMIPLAWLYLSILIWVVIQHKGGNTLKLSIRKDGAIAVTAVLLLALCMAYIFLYRSRDTLETVMNTVYPGKRSADGSIPLKNAFFYVSNLFTPFVSPQGTNQCEVAGIMGFFPLGLVLFGYNTCQRRKADPLSVLLVAVSAFLGAFCFIGFPDWLDKLTLMNFSTAGRTLPVFLIAQLILLLRELSAARQERSAIWGIAAAAILSLLICFGANEALSGFYSSIMVPAALGFLFVGILCLLMAQRSPLAKQALTIFVCSTVFLTGVLVNPIQHGAKELTNNKWINMVSDVAEDDPEALWINDSYMFAYANLWIPAGVPTISSVNVYPNLERWAQLDPAAEYEDVYNRYAHIQVVLCDEETRFELLHPDSFKLNLHPDDLNILNVGYIFTNRDLTAFDTDSVRFEQVAQESGAMVYKVHYTQ